MIEANIKRLIKQNIGKYMSRDAEYIDVRYIPKDDEEVLYFYDGNLEVNSTNFESGLGVRVLYRGAWGFAAVSDINAIESCFELAYQNAKTASMLVKAPLKMPKQNGHMGSYTAQAVTNPFEVSLEDKLDFLKGIDERLKEPWIIKRIVFGRFQKKVVKFFNSENTEIERDITNVFAKMLIMALDKDNKIQRRSQDLFTLGSGTRGYEMLKEPKLFSSHAKRIKEELLQLTKADELDYGTRSVILLPGQGHLQVHETIGHPLELDRILGYELSFAGGSFVTLDSFGNLQYGSEKLNVSAFGGFKNSPGSYGFDDEGSCERDYLLIDRGVLVNALTSRAMIAEANETIGRELFKQSGGCARATSFYRAPIDRMSNVNILPGTDGTLEDIIADTEDGIVLDNPVSWSIGSNREHFHFGCEIAWEVKNGKRGRVLRNPTYQGHTVEFYNSLSAVGNASTWQVCQVDNCGKGEPNQIMQLGHGVPVIKFDNVITGEKK